MSGQANPMYKIKEGTGHNINYRGFTGFIYQWENGQWGGNVDGGAGEPFHVATPEQAEQWVKDDIDWLWNTMQQ